MADTAKRPVIEYTDVNGRPINRDRRDAGSVGADTVQKSGTTAGKGLGAKEKSSVAFPKQGDYPTTAAWSEAMRKYREMQSEAKERALGGKNTDMKEGGLGAKDKDAASDQ